MKNQLGKLVWKVHNEEFLRLIRAKQSYGKLTQRGAKLVAHMLRHPVLVNLIMEESDD